MGMHNNHVKATKFHKIMSGWQSCHVVPDNQRSRGLGMHRWWPWHAVSSSLFHARSSALKPCTSMRSQTWRQCERKGYLRLYVKHIMRFK